MKMAELREKSEKELQEQLHELLRESFTYRTQKAMSQLKQTHLLKENRRTIARIKTVLTEKAGE